MTGELVNTATGSHFYQSLVLSGQVRRFLWPARREQSGLYAGLGLQLAFEEFQERARPTGSGTFEGRYVSDIQVHLPVTTRLGVQLRLGRWLLDAATGLDFTHDRTLPATPSRPGSGDLDVRLSVGTELQLGFILKK